MIAITKRAVSDNFRAGRREVTREGVPYGPTWEVDQIVIHVTEGNRSSVREHFGNIRSDVSAHYQVCTDGTVDQFVDEADTAFHAGRVLRATAPLVLERPRVNPNVYSIGIEHEGKGDAELTPRQREASLELQAGILARHPKARATRRHIVGHHEIFAEKSCPGAISVDALVVALGQRIAGVSAPRPADRPIVVWSDYFGDWLVVTRVVSDMEWYFVPLKDIRRMVTTRAQTALSAMPLTPPAI